MPQVVESGSVKYSFEGTLSFHTYSSLDGLVSYYSDQGQKVTLRGRGKDHLVLNVFIKFNHQCAAIYAGLLTTAPSSGVAYYYLFGVDPKVWYSINIIETYKLYIALITLSQLLFQVRAKSGTEGHYQYNVGGTGSAGDRR